jgi:WXG100 family type VII secretion target
MYLANIIKYNKIRSCANEIRNSSSDLNKQLLNLKKLQANVKKSWCGPAADEFLKHLNQLINDVTSTKRKMENVSSTIRNTANEMQRDEEERERREKEATERSGGGGSF